MMYSGHCVSTGTVGTVVVTDYACYRKKGREKGIEKEGRKEEKRTEEKREKKKERRMETANESIDGRTA